MARAGFTLVEITVAMALAVVMFLMIGGIVQSGLQSWHTEEAYATGSSAMRQGAFVIAQELQDATLKDRPGPPPVKGVQLLGEMPLYESETAPAATASARDTSADSRGVSAAVEDTAAPVEAKVTAGYAAIQFQKPLDIEGRTWSGPITIRLRDEDVNGNLLLDEKEDQNGNGALDQVVERLEDVNGDGQYDGPGESRILARNVDRIQFTRGGESARVGVYLRSRVPLLTNVNRVFTTDHRFSVLVRN